MYKCHKCSKETPRVRRSEDTEWKDVCDDCFEELTGERLIGRMASKN